MGKQFIGTIVLVVGISLTIRSLGMAAQNEPHSVFLTDASLITKKDPMNLVDWLYINDKAAFEAYDKIIVEHVHFFLKDDAEYKGINATEMKYLADTFHEALVKALSGPYAFTQNQGPSTMRVRIALTQLEPTKSGRSTLTSIVPVGIVASSLKKATTGTHIGMGKVTFEAEMLDSQTGEILGAVIDTKTGKKYKFTKSMTGWGHTVDIFNNWAGNFRNRLDRLSGRK